MSKEKRPMLMMPKIGKNSAITIPSETHLDKAKPAIDVDRINLSTMINNSYIEECTNAVKDTRKKERLSQSLCRRHYYPHSVGGQMITKSICVVCHTSITNPSTVADRLCADCAKEHNLCKKCLASLNEKPRTEFKHKKR